MNRDELLKEIYNLKTINENAEKCALFDRYEGNIYGWLSNRLCDAWETKDFKKLVKYEEFEGCSEGDLENIRKMFNWLWNLKFKTKKNHILPSGKLIPTSNLVKTYVNYYCKKDHHSYPNLNTPHRSDLESYQEDFETIKYLMDHFRNNDDKEAVAIKVCVVKDLYGVVLDSIDPIVEAIVKEDGGKFSQNVKSNELSDQKKCVECITKAQRAKNKNYSFATKYCHVHNPEFVIYDKYAAGMVIYLHLRYELTDRSESKVDKCPAGIIPPCKDKFDKKKLGDLKESLLDYSNYKTAIDNIQNVYNLRPNPDEDKHFSYDEIDKYLWGFGRDYDITPDTARAVLKAQGIM